MGTQNTYKNYIHAGGRVVAIRETLNGGASPTTKYLHQDHLGSTDVITSSTGQVLERQSFDAFGTRRVATTWAASGTPITSPYSTRGYTGHEQVDPVGLIHMNGRVYDPDLGRFISADPTVQAPGNGQSLNRYSYTINNPLAYTDPSGHRFLPGLTNRLDDHVWKPIGNAIGVNGEDFRKYGLPVLAVVTAPWAGLYAGTTFGWSTTAGYAFSGFTAGFVASGGDIEAGAYAAVTGGLYGVGGSVGAMMGSGINGYLQTGNVDGFVRGFAAGAIPQDLGMTSAYNNYALANIGIGIVRDGIRGAIAADNRDGILPGVAYGQVNNAVGHLVGFVSTGRQPLFRDGVFYYRGTAWNDNGAITFGNVVSAGNSGQFDPFINEQLRQHEMAHVPQATALGVAYIPAHILSAGYSLTVNSGAMIVDVFNGSYRGLGYYTHASNPLENRPSTSVPWDEVY
ncbi:MAG: RHS repeat-associated core domain-containing protein [Gammaproteobacteria bacterium]|nr:RHS repeat-associated core domain-containing protein [Gammaproteobacteria bacterium]